MTWLVEDPLTILALGVAAEAILVIVLFQAGRGVTLVAMAAVLLVTAAALAIEWWVVTDTERIEGVLYGAAAAVERGDVAALLDAVSEGAPRIRAEIVRRLEGLVFHEARITSRPDVVFNPLTRPPSAAAHFPARVRFERGGDPMANRPILSRMTVDLVLEPGGWRISGYEPGR